jgi:hypothetical protein
MAANPVRSYCLGLVGDESVILPEGRVPLRLISIVVELVLLVLTFSG